MIHYLLDSGFAVAFLNRFDRCHAETMQARQQIQGAIHLPVPALTEIVYLLNRAAGSGLATAFVASLPRTDLLLENP